MASKYRYKVTMKFDELELVDYFGGFGAAVRTGASFACAMVSDPSYRVGSLRGAGQVDLWRQEKKVGHVIIEECRNGRYEKIGE